MAARALPALAMLGISVMGIRLLGEAQYARFGLALSIVMAGGNISAAWLTQGLLRENLGLADAGETGRLVWVAAAGTILVSFPALLLVAAAVMTQGTVSGPVLFLTHGAYILYLVGLNLQISGFRPRRVLLAEVTRSVLMVGLALAAVYWLGHLTGEALLAACGIAMGLAAIQVMPRLSRLSLVHAPWARIGRLLRDNGGICFWFAGASLLFLADRIVLTWSYGAPAVAQYILVADAANRAAGLLLSPIIIVAQPLAALAVRTQSTRRAYEALGGPLLLQGAAGLLLLGAMLLFLQPLLRLLVHVPQEPIGDCLMLLGAASVLWQIAQVVQKPIEFSGGLNRLAMVAAGAVLLAGAFVFAAAGTLGVRAGAIGVLAAVLLYLVVVVLMSRGRMGVRA